MIRSRMNWRKELNDNARKAGMLGMAMALGAMNMLTPARIEREASTATPKPKAKVHPNKAQRKARRNQRRSRK